MASTHKVVQGDTILGIAHRYRFSDWRAIYDHPANAALRERRPRPDCLFPGDEVVIPDKIPRHDTRVTEEEHLFRLKRLRALLRLVLAAEGGAPHAGKRYRLRAGGETFEGRTFVDGHLQHEVPADARDAELTVWLRDDDPEGQKYTLQIGHLDPIEEIAGAQGRLRNLGYYAGPANGALDDDTRDAVRAFQDAMGMDEPTGELDDATRAALLAVHDG